MTGPKLTRAEHHARAMLLGRIYDFRDGTYCLPSAAGFTTSGVPEIDMNQSIICCVSLEEITSDVWRVRMQEYYGKFKPWEREDE